MIRHPRRPSRRRRVSLAAVVGLVGLVLVAAPVAPASARTEQLPTRVVELPGARAYGPQIAHNPDRDEYLAVWRSYWSTDADSRDISAVRLDRDGAPIGDPFVVAPGISDEGPSVAYNPTTRQYAVAFEHGVGNGPSESTPNNDVQASHVFAQLISDTGDLIGGEVRITPDFSDSYYFCQAILPNVVFDPNTGGYMFSYFKYDFHNGDPANCPGIPVGAAYRAMLQPASAALVPGAITMAPATGLRATPNRTALGAHPTNGTFMLMESISNTEGRAYQYDGDGDLLAEIPLVHPEPRGHFGLTTATADPLTGNWLLTFRQNTIDDTMTLVVGPDGDVIHPTQVGHAGEQTIAVAAVGDGTWVGLDGDQQLVHFGADGTAMSVEQLADIRTSEGRGSLPLGDLAVGPGDGASRVVALGRDATLNELAVATADVYPPGTLPIAPARLVESRSGPSLTTVDGAQQAIGKRPAGSTTVVEVAGRAGVPAGAEAVVLNVTQAEADAAGHFTVYPCDADRPNASSLNYTAGGAASATAFVKLSNAGTACVYTLAGAHLIVDVNSFVPARGSVEPVVPARLLETRPGLETVDGNSAGAGRVAAGSVTRLTVAGRGGVDAAAEAVLVNVTIVAPSAATFVTVFPCGEERPLASNLNAGAGRVVNNAALARVGENGQICLYSLAESHLVVDVGGFVPAGGGLRSLVPARVLETRDGPDNTTVDGRSEGTGPIDAGETATVQIAGRGGVPDDASGAALNITAVAPRGPGHMTLYPCDEERPTASNVNYGPGGVVANAAFVKLDDNGRVCVFSHSESDAVIDVVGYTSDG